MAVTVQPTYSKRSPSVKLGGVHAQKGSSDTMKIVITETTDERPGADVDDGFSTTESELAEPQRGRRLPGMASSRRVRVAPPGLWCVRVAPPESKRLDQNSPKAVAKPIGAQHYGITQYNARTEPELTESTGESGTDTNAPTTVACSGQCQPLGRNERQWCE